MSRSGSFMSNYPDSYTNGLNPMYQSLNTTSEEPLSEYDSINDSQSSLIKPPLPARPPSKGPIYATPSEMNAISSRVTTTNALYATPSETLSSRVTTTTNSLYATTGQDSLKHPTLAKNSYPPITDDYRFQSVPTKKGLNPPLKNNIGGRKGGGCACCACSVFPLVVSLAAVVSIIVSVSVIVLCVLHISNVISIMPSSSVAPISNPNNNNNNSNSNKSMNETICNATNCDPAYCIMTECNITDCNTTNCTIVITPNVTNQTNYTIYLDILADIEAELKNISLELMTIRDILPPPVAEKTKLIDHFSSRIASLQDSINQLRVQVTNTCSVLSQQQGITEPVKLDDLGNQTCPINTTKLDNTPATVTINIDDQCIEKTSGVCIIDPASQTTCFTFGVAKFFQDDRILMDFHCYVDFQDPMAADIPANGTAAIIQSSFVNTVPNQDIFNDIISDDPLNVVGCQCLSYEPVEKLSCRYFARYCNYNRGTIDNSTIVV